MGYLNQCAAIWLMAASAKALLLWPAALAQTAGTDNAAPVFDVRKFGALGNGAATDTGAINKAIDACANAGGGQVLFPPGNYLSGTVHLRSSVTLFLSAGARLVGTTNLAEYRQPSPPAFMPEARLGKWHRGLIIGENVENARIEGPGTIDGNKVFDPTGEERMRGPHTIAFANCRGIAIRDVTIVDSANYAVFFQVSDEVEVRNVKFVGGWDGVHWRGAPERWCKNVRIIGCEFYTGDDSIAGRYWDHTLISGCVINSSCNGIRVIGPAKRLIVNDCLFYGPGLEPHRTSREQRRTNMLSGIILQPGAWDATRGALDDVLISQVTMDKVASPVTIWNRSGNTVGRVTVTDLHATGVYRSALSVESWADEPIDHVVVRDASIEYVGGGRADQATKPVTRPGTDARPLPAWGVYARNVRKLTLEDVRLDVTELDARPVITAEQVAELKLDTVKYPAPPEGTTALVTNGVGQVVP
ncbi:MAG: glycoside hydrolase family 28 protein [Verrucomicrobiia bacterium]